MPGYHSNILGYCSDGIGRVFVLFFALALCLMSGTALGGMIADGCIFSDISWLYAFTWFGWVIVGFFQGWGLLAYIIISFEVIALFRVDSLRWIILLMILLTQMCETTRTIIHFNDGARWLEVLAMSGLAVFPTLGIMVYRYLTRVPTT